MKHIEFLLRFRKLYFPFIVVAFLFPSCFILERKIHLYSSRPNDAVVIKTHRDSGFIFFFKREDIKKALGHENKKWDEKRYEETFYFLDSVQKQSGVIYETVVRDSLQRYNLNSFSFILDFKPRLISGGKFYLLRFDSSNVKVMRRQVKRRSFITKTDNSRYKLHGKVYYGEKSRKVRYREKIFRDQKNGKIIYSESYYLR